MDSIPGGPPKYARLAALIRADIIAGRLRAGDRVPSEPHLTDLYGVSKTTASDALRLLVTEGLIERRAGSGSFVRPGGPAQLVVEAPRGSRVSVRWAAPGELPDGLSGALALVVDTPQRPARIYQADRCVVLFV
jgi:DNA-binding transcriptional MocR family regulator